MSNGSGPTHPNSGLRVAHLTTVDLSLRFLLWPQLKAVVEEGGEAVGISSPGPWVVELEGAGIEHIPLRSSTRGVSLVSDIKAAFQLWQVLRRDRITVLHTHNPKPGIYGRIVGRLAGVPVVVNTLHGFYATETDPWPKRAVVYGLEALAARFSDAELHQNPEDLVLAERLRIVPKGRARLLGNGIDLKRFDPAAADSAAVARLRSEWGVKDGTVVVGVVGRLVAEKGYPELFEAVRGLDDVKLVVVGPVEPDKPDALPNHVIDEARGDGVVFLGMRIDVENLYPAMDLFVLPSHREGFPRAAMEAAAMGLPVIATDIRGCRQVVDAGVNGLLVPVSSPTELRGAIASLAGEPGTRKAMGEASRRIALDRFDESRVVAIVMETYRAALAARSLSHLLPAGMTPRGEPSPPRPARAAEHVDLANLHVDLISGGFLPRLGRRFMATLYRALLEWPGTRALVVDDAAGVVGFVLGVEDLGAFYRSFVRHHWLRAAVSAFPRVLDPRNLRRAVESLRYGGGEETEGTAAEVLSLGVAPRARGRGVSTTLLEAILSDLQTDDVRVVVGAENEVAIAAYHRAGFIAQDVIEVHKGERSEVLVWHRS